MNLSVKWMEENNLPFKACYSKGPQSFRNTLEKLVIDFKDWGEFASLRLKEKLLGPLGSWSF